MTLVVVLGTARCDDDDAPSGDDTADRNASGVEIFTDEAAASGLDFRQFNGMSGELYMAEMMGPGGGLFDYDNDGDLDVYLIQGTYLAPGMTMSDALFPIESSARLTDRLFRNDLSVDPDGRRALRFTDVTAASGIDSTGYGVGIATGDYDNDGWVGQREFDDSTHTSASSRLFLHYRGSRQPVARQHPRSQ